MNEDNGAVNARLDGIDGRLKRFDSRLDGHGSRLGDLEQNKAVHQQRLADMERRTAEVEIGVDANTSNIAEFKASLKLNTFKTGAIFTLIQIVVGGILVAILKSVVAGAVPVP